MKILPPVSLQAGGAPFAGLILLVIRCSKYPPSYPCRRLRIEAGFEAVSSHSGRRSSSTPVRPPQSSLIQSEHTRSSASPTATPFSSHASREAADPLNQGHLLQFRPRLPHTISTPSRLLRLPRALQHLQGDLLIVQETLALSIACWFARSS